MVREEGRKFETRLRDLVVALEGARAHSMFDSPESSSPERDNFDEF